MIKLSIIKSPLLFVLLCFQTIVLFGQQADKPAKWLGIHQLDYQNKKISSADTTLTNDNRELVTSITDNDKNLAGGLFYRTINDKGIFHQIDIISLDINRREDTRQVEIIGTMEGPTFFGTTQDATHIQLGYRIGKMYALHKNLSADGSIGGHPTYIRQNQLPLTSLSFPKRDTRIGIGIDIRLGLNYQIHQRINIGYSIAPFTGQWFWHQQRVDNPILSEEQKISETLEMDIYFFDNLLDIRHLSLRYVFSS